MGRSIVRSEGQRWASPRRILLLGCFLVSGAASLMDQVVWLRYLSLIFGNTTFAAATLLAVFMGGLGLGALIFGRLADRLRRPLTVYAAAEVLLALVALSSPVLFGWIDDFYVALYRTWGSQPVLFAFGRALLGAVFLMPPTLLMGGTLPLMLRAVTRRGEVGRATALFYAANTLGAVAGVGLAGFVTIRTVGLITTLLLAATCNLVAAAGAAAASRPLEPEPAAGTGRPGARRTGLLALFFLMGATSLAYEVLWTRVLVFYLGSSVYAYSLMLLSILLGIALGSLVAAPWADRGFSPLRALAAIELGIAVSAGAGVVGFQYLNRLLVASATALGVESYAGVVVAQFCALLPMLGPPTLLMGLSFPVALVALHRRHGGLGAEVGAVYGANTLGSVVGALGAGFALIPLLGTQNSLLAVAGVNAVIAAALLQMRPGQLVLRRLAWAAPALALVVMWLAPSDRVIFAAGMFRDDRPEDLLYFHEDAQASVTIRRRHTSSGPYNSLELNGVNVAGTSPDLYAVQKMQGHLPMLLGGEVDSVAHIGFGSGGTAWAVSCHPASELLIVEISPEVLRASDRFFPEINHGVLDDPRVEVEINDGRNFLLATTRSFDAILSDSIHPRYSGNGSLYSHEYFQLLEQRLSPAGVASMWLPMYSLTPRNFAMILKAFSAVFRHVIVWYEPSSLNPFTIVTGHRGTSGWRADALGRVFRDPRVSQELADLGIHGPADVLACYVAGAEELEPWLERVEPHCDDLPAVEYESGLLLTRDWTWVVIFGMLLDLRPSEPPAELLAALDSAEQKRAAAAWKERSLLLANQREALRLRLESELRAGILR